MGRLPTRRGRGGGEIMRLASGGLGARLPLVAGSSAVECAGAAKEGVSDIAGSNLTAPNAPLYSPKVGSLGRAAAWSINYTVSG